MDHLGDDVKLMVIEYLYLTVDPHTIDEHRDLLEVYDLDPAMIMGIFEGLDNRFGFRVDAPLHNSPEFRTISGIVAYIRDQQNYWKSQCPTLISEIDHAFQKVKRGNGVSLHEADVIDGYGTPEQRKVARQLDTEDCWQAVPSKDIEKFHWCLSFLDPTGYRYYLPAYMVWTLRNYDSVRSGDSGSATIYSLCMSRESMQFHLDRFNAFDRNQSIAIAHFLTFMINCGFAGDHKPAQKALKNYWAQFLVK